MKKIGILFLLLCVFAFCSLDNSTVSKLFSNFKNGTVCFYCSDFSESLDNVDVQQNGDGYIFVTDIANAVEVADNISNFNGFSIRIDKTEENLEKIIDSIEIVKQEIVTNIKIFYGYICGLANSIYLNGKKVNIQIAENGDYVTIGCPIILGSY